MRTKDEKEKWLKPGERIDDLQCRGYDIIQNKDVFCFGMDAVLLEMCIRDRFLSVYDEG